MNRPFAGRSNLYSGRQAQGAVRQARGKSKLPTSLIFYYPKDTEHEENPTSVAGPVPG